MLKPVICSYLWLKLLLFCAGLAAALASHHHHDAGSTTTSTTTAVPTPQAPIKPESPTKPGSPSTPGPVTVTSAGPIRGSWVESRLGRRFQAYRGIRYAQPPVGDLRFQPPVDMQAYPGEVDASEDGPACPQLFAPADYYFDEDCLRLNVYTPENNSSRKLPVIVFVHPGGYFSMTGRSDLFGPHYLLDHDVVLVTLNYRLASLDRSQRRAVLVDITISHDENLVKAEKDKFSKYLDLAHEVTAMWDGDVDEHCPALRSICQHDIRLIGNNTRFLSTGDEVAPGNNGYKDQVSALRWVKRHAASFGGDPGLVTLAGCSAGSVSVMLHMISPMSKGLFHRGIAMSASPMGKAPLPPHQFELAQKQARILNCPTNSSRAIVDCLKTKSWQELGKSLRSFWDNFGFDPIGFWDPVIEPSVGQPRFLAVQPVEAVRARRLHAVPLIISQTQDEFFWSALNVTRNKTLLDRMNAEWETIAPISFNLPKKNSAEASRRLKEAYLEGKPVADTSESARALGKLYGDSWVGFNAHRMANLMCRHSPQPVWYSEFAYIGNNSFYEDPRTGKPAGAAHHDDLLYLFSMSYFRTPIGSHSSPQDSAMVDRMTALWYNFAKHGDPNPRGASPELGALSWPAMKPQDRKYLRVDKEFSVREKLHEDRLRVWEELYPITY